MLKRSLQRNHDLRHYPTAPSTLLSTTSPPFFDIATVLSPPFTHLGTPFIYFVGLIHLLPAPSYTPLQSTEAGQPQNLKRSLVVPHSCARPTPRSLWWSFLITSISTRPTDWPSENDLKRRSALAKSFSNTCSSTTTQVLLKQPRKCSFTFDERLAHFIDRGWKDPLRAFN